MPLCDLGMAGLNADYIHSDARGIGRGQCQTHQKHLCFIDQLLFLGLFASVQVSIISYQKSLCARKKASKAETQKITVVKNIFKLVSLDILFHLSQILYTNAQKNVANIEKNPYMEVPLVNERPTT